MNQQTFKEWKKAHPKGTVEEWLDLHTDKRQVSVKHSKPKRDAINKHYYDKKPRFFPEPEKQPEKIETKTEVKAETKAKHKPKPKKDNLKTQQPMIGEKIN
jgi:hypothetical protein